MTECRCAEVTVGTGAGLDTADMVLNIGPQHPSTHGVLRLQLVLDGERVVDLRADRRLHAPGRGEAVRGARLPADHRAGQPARLAVRVRQRAGRGAGRRAADGHRGAGAGGLAAHRARRAEPGAQPPDVPRARTRWRSARSPRSFYAFRERETLQAVHGGGLRRPDALHVQPGRRAQGGGAGRLDAARPAGDRRGPSAAARPGPPDPAQRDLPGPYRRRRRADRGAGRGLRRVRAGRAGQPGSTSTCAATSPTWRTAS